MLNSEFVSRVVNTLNSISKDDRISRRYVLHIGRQKAAFYIAQKLRDRSLYREDNLYTTLNCFELEREDIKKCEIIEFRRCKDLMKSKHKLPKLIYSRYGNTLKEVTTVDGEKEFKATTPAQYRRDLNRTGTSDYIYYYVKDRYLYLLDTEVETVDLYLLTLALEEVDRASSCAEDCCKSIWDYEFIVPDKMEEVIVAETVQEILQKKQIPLDEKGDMDSHQKTKTIQ